MMFFGENATFGETPIECSYDNPNCLGGWTGILSSSDVRELPLRSPWGYSSPPALQNLSIDNRPIANSAIGSAPVLATIAEEDQDGEMMEGSTLLLAGAAILAIILISK
jgi:hypothetical protein